MTVVTHVVLLDKMVSHAKTLALFSDVVTPEPKAAPTGKGLTAAIWFGPLIPVAAESGLSASSMLQTTWFRLYLSTEYDADIEPMLWAATVTVMAQCSMDISFGLDNAGVWTDLLGAYSPGVAATPAYLKYPEGAQFRVVDIRVPIVLEDFFQQGGSS